MSTDTDTDLQPLDQFQYDPTKSPPEQLKEVLELYGWRPNRDLPLNTQGLVDLRALLKGLKREIPEGLNAARKELSAYYEAIPPKRRAMGVYLHPQHVISLLLDRLEFFEGLSRGLVRVCKGRQCPHFSVCPYAPIVEDLTEEDGVPCAVERELVKSTVEEFVHPTSGTKRRVDPRRPEMALLFKQLVQLLVKQIRLSMHMQMEEMLIPQWEILKDGDMEKFDTMNMVEHPLVEMWDRNHGHIQRLMKDMGITPEFQIRQNLYIDEGDQIDSERRSIELAVDWISSGYKRVADSLPEGSQERQLMLEALEHAHKEAEAAQLKMSEDSGSDV